MILVMDGGVAAFLHNKADQAGFVVVSCAFSGNSSNGWNNDNPRISGYEDIDYTDEVIRRVQASDNTGDTFIVGFSAGGHTSLAYACERPWMLQAAASVDEFMGLTTNIPSAPLPVLLMEGTADGSVSYTMVKDTVNAWRAVNGLMNAVPVTTYESSPRLPGRVTQATWRGTPGAPPVAFVSIGGGTHTYATPAVETGYDCAAGLWAFFSQFLSASPDAPKIVSQPVNNIQVSGAPASFWVAATGNAPLRYQWRKNGADIAGATANWFTVPVVDLADDGATFSVVAGNESGSVTSNSARLTVIDASADPVITAQPAEQTVAGGQPATFAVTASGAPPIRYQWRKNGVDIVSATAESLQIPAALTSDSGASITVHITSAAGSVASNPATLAVTRAQGVPVMLANPARARSIPGQPATFSVSAWSASPMTYQWQMGRSMANMADIPGATDASFTVDSPALTDHGTLFRCVVSNQAGSVTSASEGLFVTNAPTRPTKMASLIQVAAQAGGPFLYRIESSGGTAPIVYGAAALPAGLSLDPASGVI